MPLPLSFINILHTVSAEPLTTNIFSLFEEQVHGRLQSHQSIIARGLLTSTKEVKKEIKCLLMHFSEELWEQRRR